MIVYELSQEIFKLKDILTITDLPESIDHYHCSKQDTKNKDEDLEHLIQEIFNEHDGNYGYRRIQKALKNKGHQVNHKRVKSLMDHLGIKCTKFSHKNRRFTTPIPLQKLVTDVTEFKCLDDQ